MTTFNVQAAAQTIIDALAARMIDAEVSLSQTSYGASAYVRFSHNSPFVNEVRISDHLTGWKRHQHYAAHVTGEAALAALLENIEATYGPALTAEERAEAQRQLRAEAEERAASEAEAAAESAARLDAKRVKQAQRWLAAGRDISTWHPDVTAAAHAASLI